MLKTGIKLDILIILALLSVIGLFALFYGQNHTKTPEISLESGLYEDSITIEMKAGLGGRIYYTLDGSEPTRESHLYDSPIILTDASAQENRLSARKDLSAEKYQIPDGKIDKANILKAKAFYFDNDDGSEIVTRTFLVMPKEKLKSFGETDLLFITVDLTDLVDYEEGMMVKGAYFDGFLREKEMSEEEFNSLDFDDCDIKANFSSRLSTRYEKKAKLEYYRDNKIIFDGYYAIRNRGVSSSNGPKKTYNLYYRDDYSEKLFDESLFPCNASLDKLILRREDAIIRDALYEKLFKDSEMLLADGGIPVQVFINGEYWGLYCLEEKMDENWFSTHLGVAGDKITVLKNNSVVFGNSNADAEFEELIDYCSSHDMTDEDCYEYFCSRVDIDSFLLYYAAMFYLDACDFSEIYNSMQWRIEGDKWHWALYDLDNSANNPSQDTLNKELKPGKDNAIGSHTMFSAVMRNKIAQKLFVKKINALKHVLSYERVCKELEADRESIILAGTNDNNRWQFNVDWNGEIAGIEDFFEKRPDFVDLFVEQYLCRK